MKSLFIFFCLARWSSTILGDARMVCRDTNGDPVAWWIIYKAPKSLKYVFLSQKDAAKGKTYSEPLREDRLLNNPTTSPFLRTVYDSKPKKENPDNRILLAWNDQQPELTKDTTSTKNKTTKTKEKSVASRKNIMQGLDLNAEETKPGSGKDMMGNTGTMSFAHSKGLLGLRVATQLELSTEATAELYLITHSFPQTPNGLFEEESNLPVKRRFVVDNSEEFFGQNILGKKSKAQHAFCISMEQKVTLNKEGQIQFDRKKMNIQKDNLFAIFTALATIGPSMTLSNYVPWFEHFKIYHQLFDVRDKWSPKSIDEKEKIKTTNVPRVNKQNGSKNYKGLLPTHLFPLWPTKQNVDVDSETGKLESKKPNQTYRSILHPMFRFAFGCGEWELNGTRDEACFAEAMITSIGDKPLRVHLLAKNPIVKVDTDDIISSRLLPHHDLDMAKSDQKSPKKYAAIVVVNQNWMDNHTFGSRMKTLVDTNRLKVCAHFHNNLGVCLPTKTEEEEGLLCHRSYGMDHSKWALSYLYQTGTYKAIASVLDLNRNKKATLLPSTTDSSSSTPAGRGGMFFISSNREFVRFWQHLSPVLEDNSNFVNAPIGLFTKKYQDEPDLELSCVEKFSDGGNAMKSRWEGSDKNEDDDLLMTPFLVTSSISGLIEMPKERINEIEFFTPEKTNLITLKTFWTGMPGFQYLSGTPLGLKEYKVSRNTEGADLGTKSRKNLLKDFSSKAGEEKDPSPNLMQPSLSPNPSPSSLNQDQNQNQDITVPTLNLNQPPNFIIIPKLSLDFEVTEDLFTRDVLEEIGIKPGETNQEVPKKDQKDTSQN